MELVGIAVFGWLVYLEWKAGRLTLPLKGHEHLVDVLATFTAGQQIVPASIITERDRAKGAINEYELREFIVSQLAAKGFPRARLHDLRQAVHVELKRRGAGHVANNVSLKTIFNSIAEVQDGRAQDWAR